MLRLFERVLIAIHPVHTAKQDRKMTMGQCRTLIENLIGVSSADVSSSENAEAFTFAITGSAKSLRINEPVICRGRCDISSASTSAAQHFREMYTDAITNVVSSLLERYDTDSLELLKSFEMMLEEDSACSEDFITTNFSGVDARRFLHDSASTN